MANLVPDHRYSPVPLEVAGDGFAGAHGPIGSGVAPIDLKELYGVIRRHLILILGITMAAAGLMYAAVRDDLPLYNASAVIRIADTRRTLTGGLDQPMAEKLAGQSSDPTLSLLQVLQSRSVAEKVVSGTPLGLRVIPIGVRADLFQIDSGDTRALPDSIGLEFLPGRVVMSAAGRPSVSAAYGDALSMNGLRFRVKSAPGVRHAFLEIVDAAQAEDALLNRIRGKPRKGTDIIDVSYSANDPFIASHVVNAVVTSFQQYNTEAAQMQSRRRRQFVFEQLQQTDSIQQISERALSEFRTRKQTFNSATRATQEQSGLLALETRRNELDAERQMAQALLDALAHNPGRPSSNAVRNLIAAPEIAANPMIEGVYQQLSRLETSRDSAVSVGAASTNPDLMRLNAAMSVTQDRLLDAVKSHINAVEARVTALSALKSRTEAGMQSLPTAEAEEGRLVRQMEINRKVADQLREEYQKARIAEAVEAGQVEIVDLASRSLELSRRHGMKLGIAVLLGLVLGTGLSFLLEYLNTTIRRRDELERLLTLPVMATIPRITERAPSRGTLAIVGRLIGGGGDKGRVETSAMQSRGVQSNVATEPFRTLRTNLMFSNASNPLRALMITSASPSEGKTTVSTNLAIAFAQQGIRVLLVDCDLRRPRLHDVFDVAKEPGLTQALLGFEQVADCVRSTGIDGLSLLPSGTLPPNPSELLGSGRMRGLLSDLRDGYDLVIVDSPPVLVAADAAIVATLCEAALVVVRAGASDRRAVQDAMRQLRAVGAPVIGSVLNDPDAKLEKYEYGGYYYYYSAYSSYAAATTK
ncbi:MAG: protein tyrosine kinase [Gemmatimonadetes bacterium]|nr:protein tyrosine kinase [Gemmatimonadota bacterium]